jgi:hypothetical protein
MTERFVILVDSDGRGIIKVVSLSAVADDILVLHIICVVLVLALAACGAEKALFAFATATHTRRIMRVVDATQVAANLSSPTGNACLIYSLVLGTQAMSSGVMGIVIDIVIVVTRDGAVGTGVVGRRRRRRERRRRGKGRMNSSSASGRTSSSASRR